jgi:hypothetical protein
VHAIHNARVQLGATALNNMGVAAVVAGIIRLGSQSYGFVIFDGQDRACLYLGFSTWHDADRAAREAQGLLVSALTCARR